MPSWDDGWTDDMNDQTHDWLAERMEEDEYEWLLYCKWLDWNMEHEESAEAQQAASRWWWVITGASVIVAAFVGFALCK